MPWYEVLVLALIQGLTEFLPISSSAHLLLVPQFTNWQDQGLAFDIVLHFGSLLAVITYFRQELYQLLMGWCSSFKSGANAQSRLAWAVILSTIPVGLAGLFFKTFIEQSLRSGVYMGYSLIIFGLLLGWADWRYSRKKQKGLEVTCSNEYQLSKKQIIVIALAQALALIPGTSRSGITITAGLLVGLTREASARFSFLLSIPVIALAALLQMTELSVQTEPLEWQPLLAGTLVSAFSAYLCIHWFLRLINRFGLQPYVFYRLLLGAYLIFSFY